MPAQTPIQRAWHHFAVLEYDQALAALNDARQLATTPAERGDVLMLEGFVQIALERHDEGLAALRLALRQDLQRRPPADLSPKLVAVFEEARVLEQARAAARVRLLSPEVPGVARRAIDLVASVDGDFAGLTGRVAVEDRDHGAPSFFRLERGRDAFGGTRWAAHLPATAMRPGATLSMRAELVHDGEVITSDPPITQAPFSLVLPDHDAALRIDSPLRGATVRIDGTDVGKIPLEQPVPVHAGRRRVELTASQGSVVQTVQLDEGEVGRVALTVQPRAILPVVRWVLIGVSAALLVTGAVLFEQASSESKQYQSLVVRDPVTSLPTTQYSQASTTLHQARAFQAAAISTVAIGGAAAAIGVGLFGVRGDRARVAATTDGLSVRF